MCTALDDDLTRDSPAILDHLRNIDAQFHLSGNLKDFRFERLTGETIASYSCTGP
jgi:hypothetical protein